MCGSTCRLCWYRLLVRDRWQEELEQELQEFTKQAEKVAEWDKHLRENHSAIDALADHVQRLITAQTELTEEVGKIESYQDSLDKQLEELEKEVSNAISQHGGRAPDNSDAQRDQMYQTMNRLEQQLESIRNTLARVGERLQTNTHQADSSVDDILRILNEQHNSLYQLDLRSQQLEQSIQIVSAALQEHAQDRPY